MRAGLLVAALLACLVALWNGCGGECRVLLTGGLVVGCGNEPPGPGDPAFGTAAEVLVTQCNTGQLLWVGINAAPTPTPTPGPSLRAAEDDEVFAEFEALRCAGKLNWIGGTVQVANDHPNGFYFDPAAILVLEDAPPQIQTTIAAISGNPGFFQPDGGGGEEQWVVPATILAIEASAPEMLMCPLAAPACPS